jgi:predicted nucleic acid-binding protein
MRQKQSVFVDTGAWIALALVRDPYHAEAIDAWQRLVDSAARLITSIPIVLETFTFLDRNATRDVALLWKQRIYREKALRLVACTAADLEQSWGYFERNDLHKLSAVDATSFAMMKRLGVNLAFAFDHHFAIAGFRLIG